MAGYSDEVFKATDIARFYGIGKGAPILIWDGTTFNDISNLIFKSVGIVCEMKWSVSKILCCISDIPIGIVQLEQLGVE